MATSRCRTWGSLVRVPPLLLEGLAHKGTWCSTSMTARLVQHETVGWRRCHDMYLTLVFRASLPL